MSLVVSRWQLTIIQCLYQELAPGFQRRTRADPRLNTHHKPHASNSKTQIAKLKKQNLPQARDPTTVRLLQEPWHWPLLPSRPRALHPPRSSPLLRVIRRQRWSSLRLCRQIARLSINSRRPSVDEANDDRQDPRRWRHASHPRREEPQRGYYALARDYHA